MKRYYSIVLLFSVLLGCGRLTPSDEGGRVVKKKKEEKKEARNSLLNKDDANQRLKAYAQEHDADTVVIHTNQGDITILLYKDIPLHRGNFLRLCDRGYYDETYFHRVVPNFVIQGGGTDLFNKKVKIGKYRIPAEIRVDKYIHKRGAVAMARYDEDNPNKESDSHEFYIVWGDDFNRQTLQAVEKKYGLTLSSFQRDTYLNQGGSPHLDGLYTVFGEVIDGLEVVGEVVKSKVDKRGWPLQDVSIKMEVKE